MDESVAQEFQYEGITEAVVIDYTSKHKQGLYLLLAGTVVICYDYLLTVLDEFTFIWGVKPRASYTKALFFLNRYLPIASCLGRTICFLLDAAVTDDTCPYFIGLNFTAWSGVINFATVELVLMTRVWLLYNRSKRVAIFLGLLFVSGFATALFISRYSPGSTVPLVTPFPDSLTRCPRSKPSEIFWLYTIAIIVEAGGFILLLLKAYGVWRDSAYTPFIATLIKQGGLYYCMIFGVVVLMTTATMNPKIYLPLVDANIVVPICSVTSTRLILSLREKWASNEVDDQDLSNKPTTVASTVQFDTTTSTTQEATTLQSHSQTYSRSIYNGLQDPSIPPPPSRLSSQSSHPYPSSSTRSRSYSSPRVGGDPSQDSHTMSPTSAARRQNSKSGFEGQRMDRNW